MSIFIYFYINLLKEIDRVLKWPRPSTRPPPLKSRNTTSGCTPLNAPVFLRVIVGFFLFVLFCCGFFWGGGWFGFFVKHYIMPLFYSRYVAFWKGSFYRQYLLTFWFFILFYFGVFKFIPLLINQIWLNIISIIIK